MTGLEHISNVYKTAKHSFACGFNCGLVRYVTSECYYTHMIWDKVPHGLYLMTPLKAFVLLNQSETVTLDQRFLSALKTSGSLGDDTFKLIFSRKPDAVMFQKNPGLLWLLKGQIRHNWNSCCCFLFNLAQKCLSHNRTVLLLCHDIFAEFHYVLCHCRLNIGPWWVYNDCTRFLGFLSP